MTSQDYTLAVCKVACGMLHGVGVERSSNVHDAALSTLEELRKKYPISVNPLLPHVYLSILHDRELKAGNLDKAEAVGVMLRSVSLVQGHGSGVELWVGGCYQHMELLAKQKLWTQARALCAKGNELCAAFALRVMQAKFMLQHAKLLFVSCKGNVVGVLPSLFRCMHLCKQVHNETLRASSLLLLAKVFVGLGLWKRAKGVLKDSGVIEVLTNEGEVAELGEAWLTLAKCHVLAGGASEGRKEFFWGKVRKRGAASEASRMGDGVDDVRMVSAASEASRRRGCAYCRI